MVFKYYIKYYRVLHHTVYKVTALLRKNEMYGIKFETNFIITIDEEFYYNNNNFNQIKWKGACSRLACLAMQHYQ